MKFVSLLLILLLTACKSVPVKQQEFPPIGENMEYKCPDLLIAPNSELLSELVKTVIHNYGEYHKCKAAVEVWHQWYQEQKLNYEKKQK